MKKVKPMKWKHKGIYEKRTVVITISLIIFLSLFAFAQTDIFINGCVREYEGGALKDVRIFIDDANRPADLTNEDGSYRVEVESDIIYKVTAKKRWYYSAEKQIHPRRGDCNFYLSKIKPFKVGAVFSVTGRASFIGDPQKKTVEMIADQHNTADGTYKPKMELIVYDDEGDATKSNLAVRKLITEDEVSAIIGSSLSGTSLVVASLAEKYKTPLVSCGASYKITWDEKKNKPRQWIFKTTPTDTLAAEAIYTHLKKEGINKIAILSDTTGFGKSGHGELVRLAKQYWMNIVADELYGPRDTEMTAQLTKIKGLAPQAIVNWSIGPAQVVVLRNWKELEMTSIRFYQSHGFGRRKNLELAASAAEGVYAPLSAVNLAEILPDSDVQKNVTMQYFNDYSAKYNEALSSFGGYAWDAINLVLEAISEVGGDRIKIREYLERKRNFVGQNGIFNFSADDHNGLTKNDFYIAVVRDGKWTLAE
jgi:branched-chain amino acid transport system substrate-binding protein